MTNSAPPYRADIRRGEIYWLDWSPSRGSEIAGIRPALVIATDHSNANDRYPNTIVVAMSNQGSARILTHLEVQPSASNGLTGVTYVKAEQIITVDKSRLGKRLGQLSSQEMARVDVLLKRAQGLR